MMCHVAAHVCNALGNHVHLIVKLASTLATLHYTMMRMQTTYHCMYNLDLSNMGMSCQLAQTSTNTLTSNCYNYFSYYSVDVCFAGCIAHSTVE